MVKEFYFCQSLGQYSIYVLTDLARINMLFDYVCFCQVVKLCLLHNLCTTSQHVSSFIILLLRLYICIWTFEIVSKLFKPFHIVIISVQCNLGACMILFQLLIECFPLLHRYLRSNKLNYTQLKHGFQKIKL